MLNKNEIWKLFNNKIKNEIGEEDFRLWIESIKLIESNEKEMIFGVDSDFKKEWIGTNYFDIIQRVIYEMIPQRPKIELKVIKGKGSTKDFASFVKNIKESSGDFYFNPEYTFDKLAVGNFNELAFSYAKHLSNNINDSTINPLFIYGGVGLGKTHIIQALGNHFKGRENIKVGYTTMEGFLSDWVKSINSNKITIFKEKYYNLDLLMVDDIQFISGKSGLQEQFFHLFNELYNRGKSIVLTADKPIIDMKDVEERLVSRFQSGQSIEITQPTEMDRLAIIKKRMLDYELLLDQEITNYMMEHINSNVRDVIAALKRISIREKLLKRKLHLVEVKEILKDIIQKKYINISAVMRETANFFDIRLSEITSTKRTKNVLIPRQVAMYFMKRLLKLSYPAIAGEFGGKDHTTVMNSVKKIDKMIEVDTEFKIKLQKLKSRF
ncbi:chromosomal replication initiator protein DnaA [bacterium]|nr:chromosomal replication initiator protein DnaA [bacterium]